jgi:hypothetical protein
LQYQREGGSITATHSLSGKWKEMGGQHHTPAILPQLKIITRCIYGAANQATIRLERYEKVIERDEALITSSKISTNNNLKVSSCRKKKKKMLNINFKYMSIN